MEGAYSDVTNKSEDQIRPILVMEEEPERSDEHLQTAQEKLEEVAIAVDDLERCIQKKNSCDDKRIDSDAPEAPPKEEEICSSDDSDSDSSEEECTDGVCEDVGECLGEFLVDVLPSPLASPLSKRMQQKQFFRELREKDSHTPDPQKTREFLKKIKATKKPFLKLENPAKDTKKKLRRANSVHEEEYKFNHTKRGFAVIINNETFEYLEKKREGSEKDAKDLKALYEALGFDVLVVRNLKDWQMLLCLKKVAKANHAEVDCFACAILSHGDQMTIEKPEGDKRKKYTGGILHDVIWAANSFKIQGKPTPFNVLTVETIFELFSDKNCPSLKGKPRLFFIQACRGDKTDKGIQINVTGMKSKQSGKSGGVDASKISKDDKGVESRDRPDVDSHGDEDAQKKDADDKGTIGSDETDAFGGSDEEEIKDQEKPVIKWNPLKNDYLVMYATPPGYFAWRNPDKGSWLIEELCKELDPNIGINPNTGIANIYEKPLRTCLTRVRRKAADHKSKTEEERTDKCVTIPVVAEMLRKDIFFNKKENK